MSRVILHVGMHKTGTTSIQNSLVGFSEGGVRYARLPSPNHTGPISAAFGAEGPEGNRLRLGRTPEQIALIKKATLEHLNTELSCKDFHTFVISGEGLVFLPPESLTQLHAKLMQYVDRVIVFAYVREPIGFCSSAFQQRTRGGATDYQLEKAQYRVKFARFIKIFGRENVLLKEFDRASLRDGSVVSDFCHLWDIPFDRQREVRTNESLSESAVKLLHLFNRSGKASVGMPISARARTAMVESLSAHFKGKFDIPARFHGAAIDVEDIAWLNSRFGISFPVGLSTDSSARPGEFEQFIDDIDPAVVASYREFLAGRGVATTAHDSTVALLGEHYKLCHKESLSQPRKLRPIEQRLRAGVKALNR